IVGVPGRLHKVTIASDLNAIGNIAGILRPFTKLREDVADRAKVSNRKLVNHSTVEQRVGHGAMGLLGSRKRSKSTRYNCRSIAAVPGGPLTSKVIGPSSLFELSRKFKNRQQSRSFSMTAASSVTSPGR